MEQTPNHHRTPVKGTNGSALSRQLLKQRFLDGLRQRQQASIQAGRSHPQPVPIEGNVAGNSPGAQELLLLQTPPPPPPPNPATHQSPLPEMAWLHKQWLDYVRDLNADSTLRTGSMAPVLDAEQAAQLEQELLQEWQQDWDSREQQQQLEEMERQELAHQQALLQLHGKI